MQQSSWIFLNGELWILWDSSCVAQLCSQSLQQPTWSCQLCSSGLDGWTGEADWRDPTARYLAADTRERSPCARERSTQRAHFMVEPSPRWLTRSWTVKAQHQRRRTGHSRSTACFLWASRWLRGDTERHGGCEVVSQRGANTRSLIWRRFQWGISSLCDITEGLFSRTMCFWLTLWDNWAKQKEQRVDFVELLIGL